MIYIVARDTGNDTETVANMLKRSKIMQTQEALEFGLATEIIEKLPLQQQESGFGFSPRPDQASLEHSIRPRQAPRPRAKSPDDRAQN